MPSIPAGVATGAAAGAGGAAALGAPYSKQREAYGDRFRVQNEGGSGSGGQPMSPTGTSGSGGPVTVHEDGGALDDSAGGEIPPTLVWLLFMARLHADDQLRLYQALSMQVSDRLLDGMRESYVRVLITSVMDYDFVYIMRFPM